MTTTTETDQRATAHGYTQLFGGLGVSALMLLTIASPLAATVPIATMTVLTIIVAAQGKKKATIPALAAAIAMTLAAILATMTGGFIPLVIAKLVMALGAAGVIVTLAAIAVTCTVTVLWLRSVYYGSGGAAAVWLALACIALAGVVQTGANERADDSPRQEQVEDACREGGGLFKADCP